MKITRHNKSQASRNSNFPRVVAVMNNTDTPFSCGLEFSDDLSDYGGIEAIPPHTARIAILKEGAEFIENDEIFMQFIGFV